VLEWLPWQDAAAAAGATATSWTATRRARRAWAKRLLPWARELTLILLLYALWQYAGDWSLGRADEAIARGRSIWRWERHLHLPSEAALQRLLLPHHTLVQVLNEFYAYVHVPALGVCLLWLFLRHRDRYPKVRTAIALVTGACLVIQLVPVAPPRLLGGIGIVDTGRVLGPSVYTDGAPGIDQLSAMPSLHVGWAILVATAVIWASPSRYRWLAIAYPLATVGVVTLTGNHYWADSIVAAALCGVAIVAVSRIYKSSGGVDEPRVVDASVRLGEGIADEPEQPVRAPADVAAVTSSV
jgi:PAP2 superfamily